MTTVGLCGIDTNAEPIVDVTRWRVLAWRTVNGTRWAYRRATGWTQTATKAQR